MSQDTDPNTTIPVMLIPGDGIGPECVDRGPRIIEATGAAIEWEDREAGASVLRRVSRRG